VWDGGAADVVPEILRAFLRARLGAEVPGPVPIASVTVPYRHAPALEYRAFYLYLPEGAGGCR
jgi:hypothetical protein